MVNVPYLRKALEHITAHPEEWDQRFLWEYAEEITGGEITIPESVKETES
jgi:hypothetical protein